MKKVPVLVYVTKVEDEPWKHRFYPEDQVLARGGIGALEYDLGETCLWFSLLGEIQLPLRRGGEIKVPKNLFQHLVDFWWARGAPDQPGWRVGERKVQEAVLRGLKRVVPSPKIDDESETVHTYDVDNIQLQQLRFSQIVERLDAGEVADVRLTYRMVHCFKKNKSAFMGFEEHESRVWIWRERSADGDCIRAEVVQGGRLAL
jgi:hypothetical protein